MFFFAFPSMLLSWFHDLGHGFDELIRVDSGFFSFFLVEFFPSFAL
jgi:hypothetical protein